MCSSQKAGKILSGSVLCVLSALFLSVPCIAQSVQNPPGQEMAGGNAQTATPGAVRRHLENYKGQNGILSAKTVVMGGEFRVTTVITFRGNVADYNRLEITRPVSLVGGALTADVSNRQAAKIKSQFESKKIFESVTVIDSYSPEPGGEQHRQERGDTPRAEGDALEASIDAIQDMEARDRQRALKEQELEQPSSRTLVTVIEVLDYAKGSRLKQALPLDLGKSILTVRLRYYDKTTGQEIGRQIISGRTDGSSLLGPLSPRSALNGVADGFVDQVTRRIAASER
jgi:hypothetical protein